MLRSNQADQVILSADFSFPLNLQCSVALFIADTRGTSRHSKGVRFAVLKAVLFNWKHVYFVLHNVKLNY